MSWAEQELNGIDLGDTRLNKRAIKMLACFPEKPTLSIPGACNGWAETQAAYRFFSHDEIAWPAIFAPHQQQTQIRMREQAVALGVIIVIGLWTASITMASPPVRLGCQSRT